MMGFAIRFSRLDSHVLLGLFFGLSLAGCSFDQSGILADGSPDAATPVDGANNPDTAVADASVIVDATPVPDATPPPDAPCWSYAPMHFDPCDIPSPTDDLVIDEFHVYDTDMRMFTTGSSANPPAQDITQSDGTDAVLISITSLSITSDGRLRVVGARPLIVASAGDIDIEGELDVSSERAGTAGAGANHANCNAPMIGETDFGGAGGSGGGGFQGVGGNGGPGDINGGASVGGNGGAAVGMVPTTVRGGCPGATGGDGNDDGDLAPGGDGGGAVQLTAQTSIAANSATLHAGGAGGSGALRSRNGGAGGGSGGYIGFDAPRVSLNSTIVAANGGGGGEGGGNGAGDFGDDGQPSDARASGGSGAEGQGGDGGDGSAGGQLAGQTATDHENGGGGGGGGGAGYIVIRADMYDPNSVTMSPPRL